MRHLTLGLTISLLALTALPSCKDSRSTSGGTPMQPSAAVSMPPGHGAMGAPGHANEVVEGKVLETMDVTSYSYMNLETSSGKVWAAVPRAKVAVGDNVVVDRAMLMTNFNSPSLNRSFEKIYFGVLKGAAPVMEASPHGSMPPASATASALPVPDNIKVDKATGAGAHTVQEVITKASELAGKQVRIKAVVVKVNQRILDRNWVHVRDGSGSDADKTSDLVITTAQLPRVGETVTVAGKVAVDRDFGSGYSYKVLVEEGTFAAEGGK